MMPLSLKLASFIASGHVILASDVAWKDQLSECNANIVGNREDVTACRTYCLMYSQPHLESYCKNQTFMTLMECVQGMTSQGCTVPEGSDGGVSGDWLGQTSTCKESIIGITATDYACQNYCEMYGIPTIQEYCENQGFLTVIDCVKGMTRGACSTADDPNPGKADWLDDVHNCEATIVGRTETDATCNSWCQTYAKPSGVNHCKSQSFTALTDCVVGLSAGGCGIAGVTDDNPSMDSEFARQVANCQASIVAVTESETVCRGMCQMYGAPDGVIYCETNNYPTLLECVEGMTNGGCTATEPGYSSPNVEPFARQIPSCQSDIIAITESETVCQSMCEMYGAPDGVKFCDEQNFPTLIECVEGMTSGGCAATASNQPEAVKVWVRQFNSCVNSIHGVNKTDAECASLCEEYSRPCGFDYCQNLGFASVIECIQGDTNGDCVGNVCGDSN